MATTVQEFTGNLWNFHSKGHNWIAIPTNSVVKTNGDNVMGAGLAKQAAIRFPEFPSIVGAHLMTHGNIPCVWPAGRLLAIPTKSHWKQPSTITLILESLVRVPALLDRHHISTLYCPHLGCGLGQLEWPTARDAIAPFLDERFIFVTPQ